MIYLNQLDGEISKELGQLTELSELYLNNNQLSGEISKVLSLRYLSRV